MPPLLVIPSCRARLVHAWRQGLPAPWDALLAMGVLAYRSGLAARRTAYAIGLLRTRRLPCRVVAVGNLTVGGTGKTPLVELLARELTAGGLTVVVLSRGYGRRPASTIGLVSDGARPLLGAAEAGDEPALLARRLRGVPVVVGRDRYRAGAWALERFQPDVLLLDDGFQQRRLHADVDVVCVDARAPWGHRGLLPRGSLREPPSELRRAHLVVLTHAEAGATQVEAEVRRYAATAVIARARYEADGAEEVRGRRTVPADQLGGLGLLAFAGIASPESFGATLAGLGIVPRALVAFPDHHRYDAADVAALEARARHLGADALVTTEKDAVRLPAEGTLPVWALRVRLRLDDPEGVWWRALEARLAGR